MPDVAGNAYPVAFGDFASAFRIYDRVALTLMRDPFTQATIGVTRFHARKRVGARVVRAEAIRKLKIATS
ncbi:MAG: phage major capsid protein [Bauldia sp.]